MRFATHACELLGPLVWLARVEPSADMCVRVESKVVALNYEAHLEEWLGKKRRYELK